MTSPAALGRRLAAYRAAHPGAVAAPTGGRIPSRELADRLARAVDGEVARGERGTVVRVEPVAVSVPVDRDRLAGLPGQPPSDAPLVCLDTETTGLGTATGTLAFLVGLGWWRGSRFEQLQLLIPDHADEPALLDAVADALPPDAWLVTYNGRTFDWPLLVTRYRMDRRAAPALGGHLDLLPHVRRLFRHRLDDARLATVERDVLGVRREGDVAGWEIPSRYLDFVRGGPARPLAAVLTHNADDVVSLARLLAHLDACYADPVRPPAGAGRGPRRARPRLHPRPPPPRRPRLPRRGRRRPGSRLTFGSAAWPFGVPAPSPALLSRERIRAERARTLRRLGRTEEALAAWEALAAGGGSAAPRAWVEAAKVREHALRDPAGALRAAEAAARAAERARLRLGRRPGLRRRPRRAPAAAPAPGCPRDQPRRPPEGVADLLQRRRAGQARGRRRGPRPPPPRTEEPPAGAAGDQPGRARSSPRAGPRGTRRRRPVVSTSPPLGSAGKTTHPGRPRADGEGDPAASSPRQRAEGPGPQEPEQAPQVGGRVQVLGADGDEVGPPEQRPRPGRARPDRLASLEVAEEPLPPQGHDGPGRDGGPAVGQLVGDGREVPGGRRAPGRRQRSDRQGAAGILAANASGRRTCRRAGRSGPVGRRTRRSSAPASRSRSSSCASAAGGSTPEHDAHPEPETREHQGPVGRPATEPPAARVGPVHGRGTPTRPPRRSGPGRRPRPGSGSAARRLRDRGRRAGRLPAPAYVRATREGRPAVRILAGPVPLTRRPRVLLRAPRGRRRPLLRRPAGTRRGDRAGGLLRSRPGDPPPGRGRLRGRYPHRGDRRRARAQPRVRLRLRRAADGGRQRLHRTRTRTS